MHLNLDENDNSLNPPYRSGSIYNNNGYYASTSSAPTPDFDSEKFKFRLFDGVDDYIYVPSSDSLKIKDAITMEAWVKADVNTMNENYSIIFNKGNDYQFGYSKGGRIVASFINESGVQSGFRYSLPVINTSTWFHIAATYDGGQIKFYYNG